MAEQEEGRRRFCAASCCLLAIAAAITGFVCLGVFLNSLRDATYSVTVTSVAGLDPAADLSAARPTLSPVFNLTVHIDNARGKLSSGCVTIHATAVVSYEDAFLAKGSVPEFCANARQVRERGARAWGSDVALPRFLRDQLAGELAVGEAAVDVEVTMPGDCYQCSDTVLSCSKAKIGGGPAPCRKEGAYHAVIEQSQQRQALPIDPTGLTTIQ